jgi:hypothetical protein
MLETSPIPDHDSFFPSPEVRWPAPSITVAYLVPAALCAPRVRHPLLRQIGDAVEADRRRQRVLDPRYLESLATVLAAHVARHHAGGLAPHKLQRAGEFIARHLDRQSTSAATARFVPAGTRP